MKDYAKHLNNYKSIVIFDCETNGLDYKKCQIIELAAIKITISEDGEMRIEKEIDQFCSLPVGEKLPSKIVELTGITDQMLKENGTSQDALAKEFLTLVDETTVLVAHNAQFDLLFLLSLLEGYEVPKLNYLDSLTIYKDRKAYPHKLSNAIKEYGLEGKVVNSHRAIDDVRALMEVLKKMSEERNDLHLYINIFGYNPKYGVSGRKIPGIKYSEQKFNNYMTIETKTLPAILNNKENENNQMSFNFDNF